MNAGARGIAPARPVARPVAAEPIDVRAIEERVQHSRRWVAPLRKTIAQVVVGQQALVDKLLVGLLCEGHVLLEGVPGLAKTLTLKTLSSALGADFSRIQFTPDMLPGDIVGTMMYAPHSGGFSTHRGPVFANLVLADEINRAPAKVQSALLEAMQERQVTLGDATHRLPRPFLVLATQNPVEQEGTYRLPEAQLDRFLLKVVVGYPTPAEERAIMDAMARSDARTEVDAVVDLDVLSAARAVVDDVFVDERVKDYVVRLIFASRDPRAAGLDDLAPLVRFGASPRATIGIVRAAKAWAYLQGRGFVTPQDVKALAPDVLRHRVAVTYDAEAQDIDADQVVARLLDAVPVP
ncbi:MAG: MoxR family ATPase [Myxococcales bacterium]|nr:MoxR family ATPase [Myxococcales bacterium]MCB9535493.1 MoxR family ATPase [Myxococcales bacterium]